MDDIKPVKRPLNPQVPPRPPQSVPKPVLEPIAPEPTGLELKKKRPIKKILLFSGLGLLVVLLGLVLAAWLWYQNQLAPVDKNSQELIPVVIESGATPTAIANLLEEKAIIKSSSAFGFYTRFTNTQNSLQAGTYRLSPSNSTPEIVEHLTKGRVDTFSLTFYPGATLVDNSDRDESKKVDVTTVLRRAGYSSEEITTALAKTYDHPVFQDKPAGTDLEGYIYGETYLFDSGATVEAILERTFDELYKAIQDNDLIAQYKAQGLNLYQGITLASIVQRESGGDDKEEIAQVFYTRLNTGMVLGSDVTYQYIADKTGVPRDTNLDSPYNTRRYAGLPPGPIAVPGLASLLAVATPASTDYVYFLSGDDNVTYFARTLAEHESNIINHCQVKCSTL